MKALEIIKEIEKMNEIYEESSTGEWVENVNFLIKAFNVMRQVAIDFHRIDTETEFRMSIHRPDCERHIDQEFEARMQNAESI